jgi:Chitin binding Peritrophin-A domain
MKNWFFIGFITLFAQQTFSQMFACPKTGLFPDPQSLNCAHYYKCVVTGSKQLINVRYKCALNFVFNDQLKLCVAPMFYRCPTLTSPVQTPGPFVCPASGDYPDNKSKDCTDYYVCLRAGDWPRPATCPAGGVFNWDLRSCLPADSFVCPVVT